jgi:uncharacterized protein (DUF58 family)
MIWYAAAILLVLVAWLFQLSLLSYAIYVLVAVLFVSRYLAKTWIESVQAGRICSATQAEVGETISVVLNIENRGQLPIAWLLVEDLLPRAALMFRKPRLLVHGDRLRLFMLGSRQQKQLTYQITCQRRGYYQVGPLLLETGDLFGLHRRHRVLADPHFIMVLPKVIALSGYDIASKRPIGEVRMTYRLYEDPTRISGVREYIPGDPLQRVHWRATARTGTLQSKVYEPSTVAGATLLLDFHQGAYDPRHEPVRSELAITTAASIANALYLLGQQCGLLTNGRDAADRIRTEGWGYDLASRSVARQSAAMKEKSDRLQPLIVNTRRGPEQLTRVLETLARLEFTDGLNLAQLVLEAEGRLPRDATVMAIVPNTTESTVLALLDLKRRGYAVTALINIYDDLEFAEASVPLLAAGIRTRHLKEETAIGELCREIMVRAS